MTNDTKTSIQLLDEVRILLQQVTEWTQRYEAALQATRQILYDWQAQTDTIGFLIQLWSRPIPTDFNRIKIETSQECSEALLNLSKTLVESEMLT